MDCLVGNLLSYQLQWLVFKVNNSNNDIDENKDNTGKIFRVDQFLTFQSPFEMPGWRYIMIILINFHICRITLQDYQ